MVDEPKPDIGIHACGRGGGCRLVLPEHLTELLASKSRLAAPREWCAGLFGDVIGRSVHVRRVVPVQNSARSPGRFQVAISALRRAAAEVTLPLVGFYHSHASEARLSAPDLAAMRKLPVVWLVGVAAAEAFVLRAMVRNGGRSEPAAIVVEGGIPC